MSAATRPRGGRLPGFVNALGALLVLVVVMSLALRAQSTSPPAIAEFAPQAQQIKEAPLEQTSRFGTGQNGANNGAFEPSPSPSPAAGVPQGAVINNCVGDPPRQIEDPQSPPCVPYWVGDNGGRTSSGVSDNEIEIVTTQNCKCDDMQNLIAFFNQRFELYGRKLHLDYDADQGTSPAQQRASADQELAAYHPFAATNSNDGGGIDYADQLARDGIISTFVRPYLPETYLAAHRPYIWSYPMAFDTLERTFGTWVCDRLKSGTAAHAGPGSLGKPRVYGLVFTTEAVDIPIGPQLLEESLAGCGIKAAAIETPQNQDASSSAQATSNDAAAVTQMKAAGVTTVLCLCEHGDLQAMGQAADSQVYFPEWVTTTYILNDENLDNLKEGPPADQLAHLFGLSVLPMQRLFQDHPSTWADPSTPYASDLLEDVRDYEYHNLLLIASGIQMAGAHLTPATFEAGLERAAFPNPDTPIHAGHVSFAGGSHAMTVDAAEIWWSNTDHGPYADEGAGTWCYVARGARHSLADPWPAGDPFFEGACDSGSAPAGSG